MVQQDRPEVDTYRGRAVGTWRIEQKPPAPALIVFAFLWNGLTCLGVAQAVIDLASAESLGMLAMGIAKTLFLTVFVIVGAALAFLAVGTVVSRTVITLDGQLMRFRSTPVPYLQTRSTHVHDLTAVGAGSTIRFVEDERIVRWHIFTLHASGETSTFQDHLEENEARFIAACVAQRYGIPDVSNETAQRR